MTASPILETERLTLRHLEASDAPFILRLVNEPGWLRFIGDRAIHSLDDARAYIETGPRASYAAHGFGLYATTLRPDGTPIGICGLVKRDGLDHPDVGFAILERYWGHGYASEAATATVAYARDVLGLDRLLGITMADNTASGFVLENSGLHYEGMIVIPGMDQPQRLYGWTRTG